MWCDERFLIILVQSSIASGASKDRFGVSAVTSVTDLFRQFFLVRSNVAVTWRFEVCSSDTVSDTEGSQVMDTIGEMSTEYPILVFQKKV